MQTEEAHLGRLFVPSSRAELMTLTKQVQEATLEESSTNKKRAQGAYSGNLWWLPFSEKLVQ
jgi:hypothetical protein